MLLSLNLHMGQYNPHIYLKEKASEMISWTSMIDTDVLNRFRSKIRF